MNTKLIDSLVQIIESLTVEEQDLLEEKLQASKTKTSNQESYKQLIELKEKIFAPPLDQYLQEGRDERTAQHDEWIRQSFRKD